MHKRGTWCSRTLRTDSVYVCACGMCICVCVCMTYPTYTVVPNTYDIYPVSSDSRRRVCRPSFARRMRKIDNTQRKGPNDFNVIKKKNAPLTSSFRLGGGTDFSFISVLPAYRGYSSSSFKISYTFMDGPSYIFVVRSDHGEFCHYPYAS